MAGRTAIAFARCSDGVGPRTISVVAIRSPAGMPTTTAMVAGPTVSSSDRPERVLSIFLCAKPNAHRGIPTCTPARKAETPFLLIGTFDIGSAPQATPVLRSATTPTAALRRRIIVVGRWINGLVTRPPPATRMEWLGTGHAVDDFAPLVRLGVSQRGFPQLLFVPGLDLHRDQTHDTGNDRSRGRKNGCPQRDIRGCHRALPPSGRERRTGLSSTSPKSTG